MTCREFMSAAEMLTPAELLKAQAAEQPLSLHAQGCQACSAWMNSHRVLGNALQGLRVSTDSCEASPAVGQAVLAAFRAQSFEPQVVEMPARNPLALWRMSRFFEVGAYAAAAAALIVGLFLGVRLLEDKKASQTATVQAPQNETNVAAKAESTEEVASKPVAVKQVKTAEPRATNAVVSKSGGKAARTEASASDNSDYVAVMLCDPLICSGDEQVIRMEMPAMTTTADGSAGKPVLADVVIGDDGLVRAMRIVNQ
jgi:hypothetical protein